MQFEIPTSPFAKDNVRDTGDLLLKDATIISVDSNVGDLERGDILVRKGKIEAIASNLATDSGETLDMRGMIICPGFVDCHRHGWEAQLRHLNPNSDTLADYCCATHFSFAKAYRPFDNYVGNILTAVGGIDAGITTFIDNSHNARTDDHAIAGLQAWMDSGVRAIFAAGPPLTGQWDIAGWPNRRLDCLQDQIEAARSPLVTLAVMAQFVPDVWAIARERGLPIVSEVPSPELAGIIREWDAKGLLGPDNIFNHITALPVDVLAILRTRGVRVNVCPRSDAQYGIGDGGMGSFQAAVDAGLTPAFSIDNETSYGGDMFGEMRTEFFLQRAMTQQQRFKGETTAPSALTVRQALEAATLGGARCAGLENVTGSLSPGKSADLIAVRANDLNLFPLNNAYGAIVHGAERANIDMVMIAGKIRKKGGSVVGLDEAKLRAMVTASRDFLMNAVGYTPNLFCDYHQGLVKEIPEMNRFWT